MVSREHLKAFSQLVAKARVEGFYPYFHPLSASTGPEVTIDSRSVIMAGSNDYLGLSHDPRVLEAAAKEMQQYGTGPGGSRFLNGNTALLEQLEERLAAFTGKKRAMVHATGFMTNLGILGSVLDSKDVILSDHENHASIFSGCQASPAKMVTYRHNDPASAREQLEKISRQKPEARILLVTDGVFSMSGRVARLDEIAAIKRQCPAALLYVDDAHGIGVVGRGGRGTVDQFGVASDADFIMGTFSKALASIGGFVASDDEDLMLHLRHNSKTLIFSAALPAANTAAVLAALDIIEREPERLARLHDNARYMREGFRRIGLTAEDGVIPILPILIGRDMVAYSFASELLKNGVFAMPAVYPAVPRKQAIIRTAYMATHERRHLDRILEVLDTLAGKYGIRQSAPAGN